MKYSVTPGDKGLVVPATVADHITPHRGDERSHWEGKLQNARHAIAA